MIAPNPCPICQYTVEYAQKLVENARMNRPDSLPFYEGYIAKHRDACPDPKRHAEMGPDFQEAKNQGWNPLL